MNIKDITIYEDENIIVLDKPSGLLVVPDRFDSAKKNFYSILKDSYKKIFIVHRLDKDTSGIVLFAKNSFIHRDLSMLWEKGRVYKTYYALVHSKPEKQQGVINKPVAELKKKKGVMCIDFKNGKKSITEYKVLKRFNRFSFLEIHPKTGRTHQIRVHLASIGCPVAGDVLYNRPEATNLKEKLKDKMPRLCLHAGGIRFFYEPAKKELELKSPIPDDMREILKNVKCIM